jgi:type IV pilus assembly protein PilN
VIKINLLGTDRKAARKKAVFDVSQQITAVCGVIILITLSVIGWRFRVLARDGARVDDEIAAAQKETTRLHAIITQVQQFEQRKAALQQRVTLIEQLRSEQIGPVHMLDQISQALPPEVWLSELKQVPNTSDVLIDGRSLALTGLSDFVAGLERSGYFQRSIDIVSSTTEPAPPSGELIRFEIRATFKSPTAPPIDAGASKAPLKPKG